MPPGADRASGGVGYPGTSPLRSAALSMAQAQLGGTIQMLPVATGTHAAIGMPGSQPWAAVPAPGWSATSGPFPALGGRAPYTGDSPYSGYLVPELTPLGAPEYRDGTAIGAGGHPYSYPPRGPAAGGHVSEQPWYEPGYDGPPRFMGAPRKHVPQDDVTSYPYGPQSYRQLGPGYADHREESRSLPAGTTSPSPSRQVHPARPGQIDRTTGPMPRAGTGPMPRADSGPMPRAGTGPMPRADSGPMPRLTTGSMPRAATGPMPGAGSRPGPDAGAMPRASTGPMPRADSGPMPRLGPGADPRPDSRPSGRNGTGPRPRPGTGPKHRTSASPQQYAGAGPAPGNGPIPRLDPQNGPRTDPAPRSPGSRSRRADCTDPGYRDIPRHAGGAGWG